MVVQTTETASSNGHGTVAEVDDVTVEEARTNAEKVLVTAAFMEVTATDVRGAVSTFGLMSVEAADGANFTKTDESECGILRKRNKCLYELKGSF